MLAYPGARLALDGNPHQLTFRHRPSGDATSVPVFVPDTALTRGKILGLEGSTLVARIDVEHSVFVSLWIDGQPVNERNASDAGSGTVRIPLPLAACDGNPHVFEIRRSVTGQVIDQFACLGPYSVTPWDALQRYSRMPLPGQLSAVAGYRYNSLSSEVAQNAPRSGLPHSRLHEILLEGFETARREFEVLAFNPVEHPDVSIVIPVHNKFDVTYVCLAAILFAANKATYEVIVVDDGSPTRLRDFRR